MVFAVPSAAPSRVLGDAPSVNFGTALNRIGLQYKGASKYSATASQQVGNWDDCIMCYWKVTAEGRRGVRVRLRAHKEMNPNEAGRFKEEEFARLVQMFDDRLAYPGAISTRKEIPADLKPVYLNPGPMKTAILFASKEMTYGIGSLDLAEYRAALAFRYCESAKTLVEIEVFIPLKQYDQETIMKELDYFTCREAGR